MPKPTFDNRTKSHEIVAKNLLIVRVTASSIKTGRVLCSILHSQTPHVCGYSSGTVVYTEETRFRRRFQNVGRNVRHPFETSEHDFIARVIGVFFFFCR